MKHFYHNEKRGYLLPESSTFLYVFVVYFRLLIAFFSFLLVFLWCISKNWWYFHDTSFAIFEKSHSIKDSESQIYNIRFYINNETLILFQRKISIRIRAMNPLRYQPFCLMQKRCLLIKVIQKHIKSTKSFVSFMLFVYLCTK